MTRTLSLPSTKRKPKGEPDSGAFASPLPVVGQFEKVKMPLSWRWYTSQEFSTLR
jgi:hypothetical protein